MHKTWQNDPCCHADHPLPEQHHFLVSWLSPTTMTGTSSSEGRWWGIAQSIVQHNL